MGTLIAKQAEQYNHAGTTNLRAYFSKTPTGSACFGIYRGCPPPSGSIADSGVVSVEPDGGVPEFGWNHSEFGQRQTPSEHLTSGMLQFGHIPPPPVSSVGGGGAGGGRGHDGASLKSKG